MRNKKNISKILAIILLFGIFLSKGAMRIAASAPFPEASDLVLHLDPESLEFCRLKITPAANVILEKPGPNGWSFLGKGNKGPELPVIWARRVEMLGVKLQTFIGYIGGSEGKNTATIKNLILDNLELVEPTEDGICVSFGQLKTKDSPCYPSPGPVFQVLNSVLIPSAASRPYVLAANGSVNLEFPHPWWG
ncbi:MAG: hypothetical protein NkDv07_0293 [Candidatus Improbicoccus devescovinae]|nr:MAG: hypothetical protein NkDv07_0293 [Candidatus Improbicoccus devescovinae]